MTETMIEKTAKAMRERYAEHSRDLDIVPWEKSKSRAAWLVCARAALQAIREPSGAMIDAGYQTDLLLCRVDTFHVFTAMIDAILSEGKA